MGALNHDIDPYEGFTPMVDDPSRDGAVGLFLRGGDALRILPAAETDDDRIVIDGVFQTGSTQGLIEHLPDRSIRPAERDALYILHEVAVVKDVVSGHPFDLLQHLGQCCVAECHGNPFLLRFEGLPGLGRPGAPDDGNRQQPRTHKHRQLPVRS